MGRIVHGDSHLAVNVKTSALKSKLEKLVHKIEAVISSPAPPDLVLRDIILATIWPKPFVNLALTLMLFLSGCFSVHNPFVTPLNAQTAPTLNLVFLGDSLTEGVPHFNGETDTMPFMVNQQFPGATYIKLGYRGQTSSYIREKFDGWLCAQYKADMENVLVLWTGTNDLALNTTDVVPQVYSNMVAMAQTAHASGWKVVAITVISRGNYFISSAAQEEFPSWQAQLNQLIHSSTSFDAVADPAPQLTNTSDTTLFWDGCHLFPKGYQIVANLVTAAIRGLSTT